MKRFEIVFGLIRIPIDFAMVVLGFVLALNMRLRGDYIPKVQFSELNMSELPDFTSFVQSSMVFALILIGVFAFFGLYQLKSTQRMLNEWRQILTYSIVWLLLLMSYFFLTRELFFSRLVLLYGALFSLILIMLSRGFLTIFKLSLLQAGFGKRRMLLVGANKISRQLAAALSRDPHYELIGYIESSSAKIDGLERLGPLSELEEIVKSHDVEEVIQSSQKLSELQDQALLEYCQCNHIAYHFVPDILEVERSNVEVYPIADLPLIHLKPTSLDGWGKVYKRLFDTLASAFLLILLSPILLFVAIGIKLDSKGPVLFTKLDDGSPAMRIGQEGTPFVFFKFRTMQDKSHTRRYEDLSENNIRKGPLVKIKNDPRITRFGRFLRRFDLDELPQLWNVLTGKMSLVGPRAHLPEEVALYQKHHRFLLTIKPGITGLSQVNGRSDLDFEDEVKLETYYIKHWSPFLDFKILLKTVGVVLKGHSAE